MTGYEEVEGDLVKLALKGDFEVIAHGCNCFCAMKSGLAPQMAKAFGCDKFWLEDKLNHWGNINKLGQIDWELVELAENPNWKLIVVNCYTQYMFRTQQHPKPLDYEALTLCLRKLNQKFKGKKIGLPQIGCHLAGGDWAVVKPLIQKEMADCHVTVVNYKP